jgi:hypothetical protein
MLREVYNLTPYQISNAWFWNGLSVIAVEPKAKQNVRTCPHIFILHSTTVLS